MGQANRYWLWALKTRPGPDGGDTPLYRAPAPNVMLGHQVCAGTVRFPPCSGRTIHQALAMFFASQFSDHVSQDKCRSHGCVLDLWRQLDRAGSQRFPLRELVPAEQTLAGLLASE